MNLEGFHYATSLDLNMGYYHLELDAHSQKLCTIVVPFGKFQYNRMPMGFCVTVIFQEKMNELFEGLNFFSSNKEEDWASTGRRRPQAEERMLHVLWLPGGLGQMPQASRSSGICPQSGSSTGAGSWHCWHICSCACLWSVCSLRPHYLHRRSLRFKPCCSPLRNITPQPIMLQVMPITWYSSTCRGP